jgi:predicted choloylglycine hydrolase
VAHTERTWGDDISALLIREIEACFKPETFLDKYHNTITSILGITCLMAGIFLPGYIEELIRQKEVAEFFLKALPNGNSFTSLSIDEKLNLALTILQPSNQLHTIGTGYKLLSMVCSMAISAVILFGFDTTKKSHILLTKKDSSEKECEEKKEKFKLAKRLISVASAIALGVAGNYAYYLLHLPS